MVVVEAEAAEVDGMLLGAWYCVTTAVFSCSQRSTAVSEVLPDD